MTARTNQTTQAIYYFLKSIGLKDNTATEHVKNIERFWAWAKASAFPDPATLTYRELLGYIQYLKGLSLTTATINIRLGSVRQYYEYLKKEGAITVNPARRLIVRGGVQKIVRQPLSKAELEDIYHRYRVFTAIRPVREEKNRKAYQRNLALAGLLIFQGVQAGELKKMEKLHVNVGRGTVYIPGSRSKSRVLKLDPVQIVPLHDYISSLPASQTKLFATTIDNTINALIQEIKGLYPPVRNAGHIRASVILHWLKEHDKRTVQYMIGHRWISSTEHYEVQELDGLTDLLAQHHPFG